MTRSRTAQTQHGAGELPDLNVWLALAVAEHRHHGAATAYWHETGATRIRSCRVTLLGLVRLLARPKLMGKGALGLHGALDVYQRLFALPEVGHCAEPADCQLRLASQLGTATRARLWKRAHLAALAAAGGLRMITFDKDFARFAGVARLQLSPR